MIGPNDDHTLRSFNLPEPGLGRDITHGSRIIPPAPGITEPEGGQKPAISAFGTSICRCDFDQYIIGVFFGVFYKNIEISVFIKYTGVR